jgi:hypothetical protein
MEKKYNQNKSKLQPLFPRVKAYIPSKKLEKNPLKQKIVDPTKKVIKAPKFSKESQDQVLPNTNSSPLKELFVTPSLMKKLRSD